MLTCTSFGALNSSCDLWSLLSNLTCLVNVVILCSPRLTNKNRLKNRYTRFIIICLSLLYLIYYNPPPRSRAISRFIVLYKRTLDLLIDTSWFMKRILKTTMNTKHKYSSLSINCAHCLRFCFFFLPLFT